MPSSEPQTLSPEQPALRVRRTSRLVYAAIVILVFVADQVSKIMVAAAIPLYSVVPVIPHFFNLTHTQNPGAAFGLFADSPAPWKTALLVVISIVLVAAVIGVVWKSRHLKWQSGLGLSLILGGALSNLSDRILHGRVIDFLDFYLRSYHWFTFNLADSAIVAGAAFLILQVVLVK